MPHTVRTPPASPRHRSRVAALLSIAVAGHVCVDLRPELTTTAQMAPGRLLEVGPMAISLGGVVGNTGLDLDELGAPVHVIANVGDDELGWLVHDTLEDAGLDVSGVDMILGSSTSYSIILEPAGVDRTIWHSVGANAAFDGRHADLRGIDVLHLGYPTLLPALAANGGACLDALLTRARSAGITTSVDLAYVDRASAAAAIDWQSILASTVANMDVISPSLDDVTSALRIEEPFSPGLVDRLLSRFLDWGAAVVALSAGHHGLFVRTSDRDRLEAAGRGLRPQAAAWAGKDLHVPPVWTGVPVTTNGAGDASSAGLVFGIAAGASAEESALLAGACAGALVSGRPTSPAAVCELNPSLTSLFARISGALVSGEGS